MADTVVHIVLCLYSLKYEFTYPATIRIILLMATLLKILNTITIITAPISVAVNLSLAFFIEVSYIGTTNETIVNISHLPSDKLK